MTSPSFQLASNSEAWPALPYPEWKDTCATLHMWTQIVGKIRLHQGPHVNHWWEVPFYVSARGLTTSAIPYGSGIFEMEFDFLAHRLDIRTSSGESKSIALFTRTVAGFYRETIDVLASIGILVKIWPMPVEVPNPIRFDQDVTHARYDPVYARRFWRVLVTADAVFKEFRAGFIGKCSPVQFFWGSFDHAVTRFSGRRAPDRPGADKITRDAYSHEVISVGWWPGSDAFPNPAFYAYAAPEPAGLRDAQIRPSAARYDTALSEFILLYDDVRAAPDPKSALLDFCQSTYDAAANLAHWDRASLDRPPA
jgi:hypothetical protein